MSYDTKVAIVVTGVLYAFCILVIVVYFTIKWLNAGITVAVKLAPIGGNPPVTTSNMITGGTPVKKEGFYGPLLVENYPYVPHCDVNRSDYGKSGTCRNLAIMPAIDDYTHTGFHPGGVYAF